MPDSAKTYSDPPGMPEDERMTDAEFKVIREHLGLSAPWLAAHLGVSERTVRHWEQGRYPIPDGVRLELEDLEKHTGAFLDGVIPKILDMPEPGILTYRTDDEYHAAQPEIDFPASWHRAVCARIAQEVPALSIAYAEQREPNFVRLGDKTVLLPGTYKPGPGR